MGANASYSLTGADVETYQTHGAVILRGAFAPWVEGARAAIEQNIANPSWRERTYRPVDGSAPFFQDYVVWDQFDGYRQIVRSSPMAKMAAGLMQSQSARIFHDHILVKEPGNSVVTPWHQDQPYYLVDGLQNVSFWLPLDPVPRARSIEYVAGSHLWGKDFRPMRFDNKPLFPNDKSEDVPDVDSARGKFDILGWDMEPGDAVAFNFKTLHGAPANASPDRRRVISLRWVGDDAKFVERQGTTSPAFPDLQYEGGAPFGGPSFPKLFPES